MNSKLTMGVLIALYLGLTVFSVGMVHAHKHAGLDVSALQSSR